MHDLTLKKVVKADKDTVFNALTKKEEIEKWFAPGPMKVEARTFEPNEGGAFKVVMISEEGNEFVSEGIFKTIDAPNKVVMSWRWTSPEPGAETTVSFILEEVDGGTEVTLLHEGFTEEQYKKRHEEGWVGCLDKLEKMYA